MKYSDLHTHGEYSDGRGQPYDFAMMAVEKDIGTLGFSDHSPVPLENCWSMEIGKLKEYVDKVLVLKKDFRGTDLLLGMELDYIPDFNVKEYINFKYLPLDYFIGSVHYVYSKSLGKYLEVDSSPESFDYLVKEGFGGNAAEIYRSYYRNVREMIAEYSPALVAHLDIVTKNNPGDRYFSESDPDYLSEVEKTLQALRDSGAIVEINMGGMSRGYRKNPFPSVYIMKRCIELGIPVTMNSDAHRPEDLAYHFGSVSANLGRLGFDSVMAFGKGRWQDVKL